MDNPAYQPNLAAALNNLGNRYSDVGRPHDALAATEEAVTTYQAVTVENPAHLPNLGIALLTLERRYDEAGAAADRFDTTWTATLNALPGGTRGYLWWRRAAAADPGEPHVVDWLVAALDEPTADRSLTAAVHEQARRHRAPDPTRLDTEWTRATGQDPPGWLLLDPQLLTGAQGWISTDSYTAEQDWLTTHPEILDQAADPAVDEALLPLSDQEADRYRALRATAQADGVDAAYRPVNLQLLAHRFLQADTTGQRALLTEHLDDLNTDIVDQFLDRLGRADTNGAAVIRARSLIQLAGLGAHETALDALNHDPPLLAELLFDTTVNGDPAAVQPLALLAYTAAHTDQDAATAILYIAVATTLSTLTDPDTTRDDAADLVSQARGTAPGHEPQWIALLARIGTHQPAVMALIPCPLPPKLAHRTSVTWADSLGWHEFGSRGWVDVSPEAVCVTKSCPDRPGRCALRRRH